MSMLKNIVPEPSGEGAEAGWDCHVHVFGPYALYPLATQRPYTPPEAPLERLREHLAALHISRAVLVQPSPFAWDNRCLLAGLRELGDKARGVLALRASGLAELDLDELWRLGARGLRINPNGKLQHLDSALREEVTALARGLQGRSWHLEFNATQSALGELLPLLKDFSLPVVAGHLADFKPGQDLNDKKLNPLYTALEENRLWIKISGWDRYGDNPSPKAWAGLLPRLLEINDQALLWGSDWPHTPIHKGGEEADKPVRAFRRVDDRSGLDWLRENLSAETCRKIFMENPARLYS